MTYRELISELKTLSEEQLNQTVAVNVRFSQAETDNDYWKVTSLAVACDDDVLSDNHLVLDTHQFKSSFRR